MKFGKSPVNSFCGEVFCKDKDNKCIHACTHMVGFASIDLIYQNFDVVIVCILAVRLQKAPKGSNSNCY